jgi:hypothetical protein
MITQPTGQRVFESLFIAGLGVIWGLDLWWPGLLIDFGIAYGVATLLRKRYFSGGAYLVIFGLVPALYVLAPALRVFLPLAVVGLGVAELCRALKSEAR